MLGVHEADEFRIERAAQGTSCTGLQRTGAAVCRKREENLPTKEEFVYLMKKKGTSRIEKLKWVFLCDEKRDK
jgi:hypothetical protein